MIEQYTIPAGLTRKKILNDMKKAGIRIYNDSVADADFSEGEQLPTEAVTLTVDLDTLQFTNMTRYEQIKAAGKIWSAEEAAYLYLAYFRKHKKLAFNGDNEWWYLRCRNKCGTGGWVSFYSNPGNGASFDWIGNQDAYPESGVGSRKVMKEKT